jgi:outer membrane biosynthesis protein TonB
LQERYERPARRRDGVTIPRIWIAVAFSLAIHSALLWTWRYEMRQAPSEGAEQRTGPLIVQIVPPPRARTAPEAPPRVAPPAPPPQPKTRPQPAPKIAKPGPAPKPPPDVLARTDPVPRPPVVPPSPPAPRVPEREPPAAARAPEGDLSALVEARRRARAEAAAEAAPPAAPPSTRATEDANTRANRLAAANLGTNRKPSFGSDNRRGGGVFGIERLSYDSAEFTFFGWNKDIKHNTMQLIEVRKGDEPDIRIAVIRRMISIIREHEKEEFIWESKRLGRDVVLSARPRDTRGLEDFLMREFF